jgi:hypothetical protein
VNDPFEFLGLAHDADERAIKRAYARRLRDTRPESDPAGFQVLNEAYRCALDWAQERDSANEDRLPPVMPAAVIAALTGDAPVAAVADAPHAMADGPVTEVAWTIDAAVLDGLAPPPTSQDMREVRWDEAPHAASTAHEREEIHEAFAFASFFAALCETAALGDADALLHGLQRQPALWSLTTKARAAQATMAALHAQAPPMPERCFDVVLAFFDMDHVLAGQDPLKLGRLRQRLHAEWLLLHDKRELAADLRAAQPPVTLAIGRLFALLSGPFRWHRVLLQALPPGRPSDVATFLRHLQSARVERLPPAFDRQRIAFWLRAGDRDAISLPRIAVGFARCLTLLLIALITDGVLAAFDTLTVPLTSLMLVGCALWALYIGWTAISRWQNAPQEAPDASAGFWLRLLFIPFLCVAACALRYVLPLGADGAPSPLALGGSMALDAFAIVIALTRYRRRAGSGPLLNGGYWAWLLGAALIRGVTAVGALLVYYTAAGAAVAMAIWLADLVKQRARLFV